MAKKATTKKAKPVTPESEEIAPKQKGLSIFDHLSNISENKRHWSTMDEPEQKSFLPFMINKWLSMNPDLLELVADLQRYTVSTQLTPREVYMLYSDILPQSKLPFCKYIKASAADKYNSNLVTLIISHFSISKREALSYLDTYMSTPTNIASLRSLIAMYGKVDKEIDKLLKPDKK